ncbi:hypothetical protein GCM10027440_27420 [Nocardiopsis coralliicola]
MVDAMGPTDGGGASALAGDYLTLVRALGARIGAADPFTWLLDDRAPPEPGAPPALSAAEVADGADRIAREAGALPGQRAGWLAENARALHSLARITGGAAVPLQERVEACLGVDGGPVPEEVLDEAADLLDQGLPKSSGTLRQRWDRWRSEHSIRPGSPERVEPLIAAAVDAALERTRALVDLPADVAVDCEAAPGPFRGLHRGGSRGTVFYDPSLPFITADLLYTAAHEAFPGHIAEYMLKERTLADRPEAHARFMPSPCFTLSEGLALHAQEIAFPGDEALRWLVDHVDGFRDDGTDLAAVHRARNLLWGAWCNAAHLLAEGRPHAEVRRYLQRRGMVGEAEAEASVPAYLGPYIFAYYHGARLAAPHTDPESVRRLLTEQVPLSALGAP